MKIGYLLQSGVPEIRARSLSGPAIHVRQVCKELTNLGHRVKVIAWLESGIWKTDDLVHFTPVKLPLLDQGPVRLMERVVRRIQSALSLPYLALFDSLRFCAACCKELRGYDLLYERMGWMGGGGSFAAGHLGIPHVLEVNGDHLWEHEILGVAPSGFQRQISVRLMARVIRRANHAVATGEGWRQSHILNWKVDPSKVSVIQNGSQVIDLLSRDELHSFAAPVRRGRPLELIYVGSFDPWQNLPLLLRTVSRAVSLGSDVHLTLAGTGVLRNELLNLCTDLQLERHVTFAGHLPMRELLNFFKKADVGISLYHSRQEFTGLKLLDYMGAGLATIATGLADKPSLIRDGVTGKIIPPDDGDALWAAIREFELNPKRVSQLGRQARIEAEQQYRWRNTATSLQSLFLDLLKAKSEHFCNSASHAHSGYNL